MVFTHQNKEQKQISGTVIPIKSSAFLQKAKFTSLSNGEILLANRWWNKRVKEIELSLEDETPTLMRNRLSNALLFNYVIAVGAEACSLAAAIKCHIYCVIIL